LEIFVVTAERALGEFIVRYFEKELRSRVWWSAGRPFIPIVQYEDDAGDKQTAELWIDDFARRILDELRAR
jgi:hypothetical protein